MFFLARSAVCIGLVVSALPDTPGRSASPVDEPAVASAATAAMVRLCRAHPASCAKAIQGLAATATTEATGPAHRRIPTATRVL